jgi:hypothetical protein
MDVFDQTEQWLRRAGWVMVSRGQWEFVDKRNVKTWTNLQGAVDIQRRREAAHKGARLKRAPSRLSAEEQGTLRRDLSSAICVARNEYDDERDGDFDDYIASHVMVALDKWSGLPDAPGGRDR